MSDTADRQRAIRNGNKYYCTNCTYPDGETVQTSFFSKQENDQFAQGLELMGVTDITKSFYNPSTKSWHQYHSNDGIEVLNRQAMNRLYIRTKEETDSTPS